MYDFQGRHCNGAKPEICYESAVLPFEGSFDPLVFTTCPSAAYIRRPSNAHTWKMHCSNEEKSAQKRILLDRMTVFVLC